MAPEGVKRINWKYFVSCGRVTEKLAAVLHRFISAGSVNLRESKVLKPIKNLKVNSLVLLVYLFEGGKTSSSIC